MSSRSGRSSSLSNVVLASGATALLGGISLLFSLQTASILKAPSQVSLNAKAWSWVTDIRLGLQTIEPPAAPELQVPQPVTEKGSLASGLPLPKLQAVKPVTGTKNLKTRVQARRSNAVARVLLADAVAPQQDQIRVSAAAPTLAVKEDGRTEHERMRAVHQTLTARFALAFNGIPALSPADATAVAKVTIQPKPVRIAKRKVRRLTTQTVTAAKPAVLPQAAAPKVTAGGAPLGDSLAQGAAQVESTKRAAPLLSTLTTQVDSMPARLVEAKVKDQGKMPSRAAALLAKIDETLATPQEAKEANPAKVSAAGPVTQPEIFAAVSRQHQVNTQKEVTTQAAMAAASVVNTVAGKGVSSGEYSKVEYSDTIAYSAGSAAKTPTVVKGIPIERFVEAFNWHTAVQPDSIERLTKEVDSALNEDPAREAGWRVASASAHWPTIFWSSSAGVAGTPVLSNSSAFLLSKLADVAIQQEAGIIFGRVPAGWTVELSGRAEAPLFFNLQNQPVSADRIDLERAFAFLNTEPGAHLVYAVRRTGADGATVAAPVMRGAATYVDLTQMSERRFAGRVLDASAVEARGLPRVQVKVVGLSRTVFTDASGGFHFDAITTVGDYPVFVETDARSGYTHRYRLTPGQLKATTLFRMSEKQIHEWLGQVEGGVSADAGMIVSAVPRLTNEKASSSLRAAVQPLLGRQGIVPETYSVAPSGQILDQEPLDRETGRFLALQVPEGPVVAAVEDETRTRIWSQLLIASPGVINVVGVF